MVKAAQRVMKQNISTKKCNGAYNKWSTENQRPKAMR